MSDELKPCPFCSNAAEVAEAAWRKANLLGVELAESEANRAELARLLAKAIERRTELEAEVRALRNQVADGTPGEYELRGWGMW